MYSNWFAPRQGMRCIKCMKSMAALLPLVVAAGACYAQQPADLAAQTP